MSTRCIAIGASAGGLKPLTELIARLPAGFPIPVFVVMHIPAFEENYLPDIISHAGRLPAISPDDNDKAEPGMIYVAPPDHHMLLDDGHIAVKRGPKENGFRPSIDALFRSAAYSYGPGAVGVVLSGALSDGTSGLWSIKRLGGIAMVQDPKQAQYPSMPRSAMEFVEPDLRASPKEIGERLAEMATEPASDAVPTTGGDPDARRMAIETQIAAGVVIPEKTIIDLGDLTEFTCPECHGTLVRIAEGKTFRCRCHTGHGFSADALLASLSGVTRELLWQTTRSYQEASMLLEHIGNHLREHGDLALAGAFQDKARQITRTGIELHKLALSQETLSEDAVMDERTQRSKQEPRKRK